MMVFINITNVCQLRCNFCALSHIEPLKPYVMNFGKFWAIVNQVLMAEGVSKIDLTPIVGEVLLDDDLHLKLDYLEETDTIKQVLFATNFLELTEGTLRKLLSYKKLFLDISVYGHNPESYHLITNRNYFNKFLSNIRLLSKCGTKDNTVQFTLRRFIDENSELADLIEDMHHKYGYEINVETQDSNFVGLVPTTEPLRERTGICRYACYPVVYENGDVGQCGCWDLNKELYRGNIWDTPFERIINSFKFKDTLLDQAKNKYPMICEKCTDYVMESLTYKDLKSICKGV